MSTRGSLIQFAATFLIIIAIFMVIGTMLGNSGVGTANIPQSTVNRERLAGGSFTSNCVVDEIGWLREAGSSEQKLGSKLEYFWKETGVQPYLVLLNYSSEFESADARYDYADELYESLTGGREDAIMLVYFDNEPDGNWEMVKGRMAASVMDDEATEILWGFSDRYWYDLSYTVPQALENTFDKTADSIMRKATTGMDVMSKVVVVIGIVVVIVGVVVIIRVRRKAERERAEETERILQAGQNQQTFGSGDDDMSDLTSRYDNME